MDVVDGVDRLRPEHGPIFAVIGVFDGLHRGHGYLLERLRTEAATRSARPTVITFDHHPDEVLTGSAPPLLVHPDDRLERLADAGVAVTVLQPFDETVRRTPYDAFVEAIQQHTMLAGLLMTPDAAFGYERRGTPEALSMLGRERGFDVVVAPTFTLDGEPVSSSAIRSAIGRGDLRDAERLLGRPVCLRGVAEGGRLTFEWPMALPPDGTYRCAIDGRDLTVAVEHRSIRFDKPLADGPVEVVFLP